MNTHKNRRHSLPLLCAIALFSSPQLHAQVVSTTEHQRLDPQDVSIEARFGRELAMSGDTLIVGAPHNTVNGQEAGTAHVYVANGNSWTLQQVLVPSTSTFGMLFGQVVAIDGDLALVGAPVDGELGPGSGAAYLFERSGSTWTQTAKLLDNNAGANFNFGMQVAIEGDYALVAGRDHADFANSNPNEVHAYSLSGTTWQLDQVFKYEGPLSDPLLDGFVEFGTQMSMDGNRVAIMGLGSAQTYTRGGSQWTLEQTVFSTVNGFLLATDVDLKGDLLAVSFQRDQALQSNQIGAIVYRRSANAWSEEQQLLPSAESPEVTYAASVAVDGGVVAVGAKGFSFTGQVGEVTLFERHGATWIETVVLKSSDGFVNDRFGGTLAASGGRLVAGAYSQDPGRHGNAYAFSLTERPVSFCTGDGGDSNGCGACPCGNDAPTGSTGGCLNAASTSASLNVSGAPSLTNDTLRMELEGANPSTFAILISGAQKAPNNTMNPCFGTGSGITFGALSGLRCVVQDVRRQGTRAIDAQGAVGETNNGWGGADGPSEGLLAQAGLVAGQTRHYQAFYRETPTAGCMRDQNTSQGISIVVRP